MNDEDATLELSKAIGEMLEGLEAATGAPRGVVLLAAHAQVATELAMHCGGPEAAAHFEKMAARLRALPSLRELQLAAAEPGGTA